MKNILVPIGASKNAVSHLQYAVDFAKAFGAKLYVVQFYNVYTKAGTLVKIDHILERESMEFLNRLVSQVDTKDVDIIVKSLKGKLIETLELAAKTASVDLILIEPRTTSYKEEVYLGKTSGKIVKQTSLPALIVPEGEKFSAFSTMLLATKSALIENDEVLKPLKSIKENFNAQLEVLLVKTPMYSQGDFELSNELKTLVNNSIETVNPTTFQALIEHTKSIQPDLICVFRRKRGFFTKLWENNTILKKDFYSTKPVLVLSGLSN